MENKVINGVWRGGALTNIQKLSIRSFQDFGHSFHLWTENPVEGVPSGTIIRDAHEVLPARIPEFSGANYYSDYFRAMLIFQIGGWYTDVDEICLRPFDFPEPYVFVSEVSQIMQGVTVNNGCLFKASAGSPFLKKIIDTIEASDTLHPATWISFGPELFLKFIPEFDLQQYVKSPEVFDPLRPEQLQDFIWSSRTWDLEKAYCMHLRTSYWTDNNGLRPNGDYNPDSLFEQLKRKHGV